jgi:subtilisin family serine protease
MNTRMARPRRPEALARAALWLRLRRVCPLALSASFAAGCGDADEPGFVSTFVPTFVPASPDAQKNVLVVDDGFDLAVTPLQGKVAAAFTIRCAPPAQAALSDPPGPASPPGPTPALAEKKRAYLESLGRKETSCRLVSGISARRSPLAPLARYRARWNDALRADTPIAAAFTARERAELRAGLESSLGKTPFHGTATAGLIAHANPGVALVLVETPLASAEEAKTAFSCLVQAELDEAAALLADPEVLEAYARAPRSTLDEELDEVQEQHRVGLVNRSYGTFPRPALEALQRDKGCPPVDLRRYFQAFGAAEEARARHRAGRPVLDVQAAGNEGSAIEAAEDALECRPDAPLHLLVGSYGQGGARSGFSNFGRCVDLFAPGELVVAPLPGDFLYPVSGTSFSAPLVVRLVSAQTDAPFEPLASRAALVEERDDERRIPEARFPAELVYAPPRASQALTAEDAPRPPDRSARPPTLYDLDRALAPLRAIAR